MKYLVLLLVILLVVWLAKSARGKPGRPPPRPGRQGPAGSAAPGEVMLVCAHCGVHLPSAEALPGRGGVYCSEAHRAAVESRHGGA